MDVPSFNNKGLDVFYNELRRKYPNTFTLATDLGKGDGSVHKLPLLGNTASLTPLGILPNYQNTATCQRWTSDSFLSKLRTQKTQNEQRQRAENSQRSGGSIIIQDKTVSVATWNRRDLDAQNRSSFRLPTLRAQVEQNKAELKNRLNTPKKVQHEQKSNQSDTLWLNNNVQTAEARTSNKTTSTRDNPLGSSNVSVAKSDPLGIIMKELLPNKPGRLMTDLSKNTDNLSRNGGCISDSDSGVSVCTPINVFRPKIRNQHDAPASSDIIKKFSTNPKTTSGPIKAAHIVMPDNIAHTVNVGENPVKMYPKKSSINFNEKKQRRSPKAVVHFEDESEQDALIRYHERSHLERTHTTKISTIISSGSQIKSLEWNSKPECTETSPSPSTGQKLPTTDQQTVNFPYRRQPFPPSVAKKVLIDIPSSSLPRRRAVQLRMYPAMRDMTNKQMSPRDGTEATSLDGITVSFASNSQEWRGENKSISESRGENKSNQSLSSLETIESGITEVSSEVTIMTMESGGSGSYIGSENQTRASSQNHDFSLDRLSLDKEISFYSKVKRSLQVKMKLTSDTRLEKAVAHGESIPRGTNSPSTSSQIVTGESAPGNISKNWMKMDVSPDVETQNTGRTIPVKAPFFRMKMIQSLMKKGRPKDYLVHVPSPPPQESRPQSRLPVISAMHTRKFKREEISDQDCKTTSCPIKFQPSS